MFRRSLTIARLYGIPVRLHWSWLLVLAAVIFSAGPLYARMFGDGHGWVAATCAALLILLSVLLHELGHGLVARVRRLRVRSVTLFVFGGFAEIDDEVPGPLAEFVIAIAGPVVSLVLAGVSGMLWLLLWEAGAASASLIAGHVALVNVAMAVLNLLPGYPLDGGRMLRAILWFLFDDPLPATRLVSLLGRLAAAGIWLSALRVLVMGAPLAAAWTMLVGFFLYRGAVLGYRQVLVQHTLAKVAVADLMQRFWRSVPYDLSLEQFVGRYVLHQSERCFVVVRDHDTPRPQLDGMISLRDLRRYTIREWPFRRVHEVMTPSHQVRTLHPDLPASEALRHLLETGDELLPVIHDEMFVGVLRLRDLITYMHNRIARRR